MNCSKSDLLEQLAAIVGAEWVKQDPADLNNYGKDWTKAYAPAPIAVVLPGSIDAVVDLVKLANRLGLAIVPSGGRT